MSRGSDASTATTDTDQRDEPLRYEKISETGLYKDATNTTLAAGVRGYAPQGQLYSDGATKRRWIKLPDGGQIDTSDMDQWRFPVGTKMFKEFTRDGTRVETRIIEKLADDEWFMMAYIWNAKQTEAVAAPDGADDANGTDHDVPSEMDGDCVWCHDGRADKLLGFSALQLSHQDAGLNLGRLVTQGLLSDPPAGDFSFPGNEIEQSALRYLHANCGHCHNPTRTFALPPGMEARGVTTLFFWQEVDRIATIEDTITHWSVVATRANDLPLIGIANRVKIGNMPLTGTELVDPDGLARLTNLVELWQAYFDGGADAGTN